MDPSSEATINDEAIAEPADAETNTLEQPPHTQFPDNIKTRRRLKPIPAVAKPLHQLSKALPMSAEKKLHEAFASITIDDEVFRITEIRATGDIILDVTFDNTSKCEKSIEGGDRAVSKMKEELKKTGNPPSFTRRLYRVRLDTLKRKSIYFANLLGNKNFSEASKVTEAMAVLEASQSLPSEAPAQLLPRLQIEVEEDSTRTMGREKVFEDLLWILHDQPHKTESKYIGLQYVAVLVTMAERFDCIEPISRYMNRMFARLKFPPNTSEEIIRKKIMILALAEFTPRLGNSTLEGCTKDLILQGSVSWLSSDEDFKPSSARWWYLPLGLEDELAFRRQQIILALASLQDYFLGLYNSKERQCTLGYDSSPACDSFQLGEMIKFLSSKKLLSLSSFSGIGPHHENYFWPDAYAGNLEDLVTTLHQVPSYQIDLNHHHCGLRARLLKPLEYIQACMTYGSGIPANKWHKDRAAETWVISKTGPNKPAFVVDDEPVDPELRDMVPEHVRYWLPEHEKEAQEDPKLFKYAKNNHIPYGGSVLGSQTAARKLFMAEIWDWRSDKDVAVGNERLGKAFGSIHGASGGGGGRGKRGLFGR